MTEHVWLAFHIHYCDDPTELICQGIAPMVQKLYEQQCIGLFFFIRYLEGGPHIRLRVAAAHEGQKIVANKVREQLEDYLVRHPSSSTLALPLKILYGSGVTFSGSEARNNIVLECFYEPETARYGGSLGLPLSERLFCKSSILAIQLLARIGRNDALRFGVAAEAFMAAVVAICSNAQVAKEFVQRYATSAIAQLGLEGAALDTHLPRSSSQVDTMRRLWLRHQFHAPGVAAVRQGWTRRWGGDLADTLDELFRKRVLATPIPARPGEIDETMFRIAASHIHLLNNRLGLDVRAEMELSALMVAALSADEACKSADTNLG